MFNDMHIFIVDGIQTMITNIKGNLAKGFILQSDLTLTPCFVVKDDRHFAHGETVKEAREALQAKIFESMDTDETIDRFMDTFKPYTQYKAKDFYDWHHYLTGSCEMGRKSFMKDHDIDFDTALTVDEFIKLCENDFGGEIIKELKEKWNNKGE